MRGALRSGDPTPEGRGLGWLRCRTGRAAAAARGVERAADNALIVASCREGAQFRRLLNRLASWRDSVDEHPPPPPQCTPGGGSALVNGSPRIPAAISTASSGCSRTLLVVVPACSRTASTALCATASTRPAALATSGVTRSFIRASTCSRSRAMCAVSLWDLPITPSVSEAKAENLPSSPRRLILSLSPPCATGLGSITPSRTEGRVKG